MYIEQDDQLIHIRGYNNPIGLHAKLGKNGTALWLALRHYAGVHPTTFALPVKALFKGGIVEQVSVKYPRRDMVGMNRSREGLGERFSLLSKAGVLF